MDQRLIVRAYMFRHAIRIHFVIACMLMCMVNFGVIVGPDTDHFDDSLLKKIGRELGLYHLSSENFQQYGTIPTIWLFVIRLMSMVSFPILCSQVIELVAAERPPGVQIDLDELAKIEEQRGEERTRRPKVHCMCIRLLTRGDEAARGLITNSINAAVQVLKKYLDCQHLKVHIVTQTKFLTEQQRKHWIAKGATEVREIFVPPDYRSARGTLFKARNIQLWTESGGVGSDCTESASWVLSLDEEAIVLPSLLRSFIRDVLNSPDVAKIGYATSPSVIDVKTGRVSLMVKMMETRFMAWQYWNTQCRTAGVQDALFFHGGAFFVRANVDRLVGSDWGPKASVAEDFAEGLVSADKKIGCKYLGGWYIEGPASSLGGHIRQRARVLRGQLYTLYLLDVSRWQKIRSAWFIALMNLFPMVRFSCALIALSPWMYPAGPRCLLGDISFITALAIQSTCFVFGASCMNVNRCELFVMVAAATPMVLGLDVAIDSAVAVTAMWQIFREWRSGQVEFEVTKKPAAS